MAVNEHGGNAPLVRISTAMDIHRSLIYYRFEPFENRRCKVSGGR